MEGENLALYLFGGGAITTLLGAFLKGFWDWLKGRHDAERASAAEKRSMISTLKAEVREAESQADAARDALNAQHRKATAYLEYASTLRQHVICSHGIDPADLPPWPDPPPT